MKRRAFLMGTAMGAAGFAGAVLKPRLIDPAVARGTLAKAIPAQIGGYGLVHGEGVVLPVQTPLTRRIYSDVLVRLYADASGALVMLLAAAGAATGPGLSVHRPERCYPAAGFEIEHTADTLLQPPAPAAAQARFVTAVRGERRELVQYWVRVGQAFPLTEIEQRVVLLEENLHGVIPAALLVRLSVLSTGRANDAEGFARLEAFSRDLAKSLSSAGMRLIFGR